MGIPVNRSLLPTSFPLGIGPRRRGPSPGMRRWLQQEAQGLSKSHAVNVRVRVATTTDDGPCPRRGVHHPPFRLAISETTFGPRTGAVPIRPCLASDKLMKRAVCPRTKPFRTTTAFDVAIRRLCPRAGEESKGPPVAGPQGAEARRGFHFGRRISMRRGSPNDISSMRRPATERGTWALRHMSPIPLSIGCTRRNCNASRQRPDSGQLTS